MTELLECQVCIDNGSATNMSISPLSSLVIGTPQVMLSNLPLVLFSITTSSFVCFMLWSKLKDKGAALSMNTGCSSTYRFRKDCPLTFHTVETLSPHREGKVSNLLLIAPASCSSSFRTSRLKHPPYVSLVSVVHSGPPCSCKMRSSSK